MANLSRQQTDELWQRAGQQSWNDLATWVQQRGEEAGLDESARADVSRAAWDLEGASESYPSSPEQFYDVLREYTTGVPDVRG